MRRVAFGLMALLGSGAALADVSYLKCDVQVTFRKPTSQNTEWSHLENRYTKYLRLDSSAKAIALFDDRHDLYKPICSSSNSACAVDWTDSRIHIDGMGAVDDSSQPHLDFRRSVDLSENKTKVHFVIADYGDSTNGKPNMTWSYDGNCSAAEQPKARVRGGPPAPKNPSYEVAKSPALPVSDAERDRVLANYNHNTMWGFSGGGHWFHMWFFEKGLSYAGDDMDFSSEGAATYSYIGKDPTGYRICRQPIPPQGSTGCYPLLDKKVGDSWVEHDMDGDAQFSMLPGRQ